MTKEIQTSEKKPKLLSKFAEKFGVDEGKLMDTLKATCFKSKNAVSNQEMMALLIVADQYGLNPFTKEIFAFPDGNKGIVPVVGVDGWSRIINNHKELDGFEFNYSEEMTTPEGGQQCPEWCEVVIYRKDRAHPTVVREYLDEVYRPPFKNKSKGYEAKGPWQSHTKRFLRHKVLIQGARLAFGFGGIYDEDEAARIIDVNPEQATPPRPQQTDFEPPVEDAVELFQYRNADGVLSGKYHKRDFTNQIVEEYEQILTVDFLTALSEHNAEEIERLGTRTEERKEIAEAFNAAYANLEPTSSQEDADEAVELPPGEYHIIDFDGSVVETLVGTEAFFDALEKDIKFSDSPEEIWNNNKKTFDAISAAFEEADDQAGLKECKRVEDFATKQIELTSQ